MVALLPNFMDMTMTKSAIVQARMEPNLKQEADAILATIGLNATTAITLFYTQIVNQHGLPLDLKVPNSGLQKAMCEARDPEFRKNTKTYNSAKELFDDIDS